jgi:hypothetical protein
MTSSVMPSRCRSRAEDGREAVRANASQADGDVATKSLDLRSHVFKHNTRTKSAVRSWGLVEMAVAG